MRLPVPPPWPWPMLLLCHRHHHTTEKWRHGISSQACWLPSLCSYTLCFILYPESKPWLSFKTLEWAHCRRALCYQAFPVNIATRVSLKIQMQRDGPSSPTALNECAHVSEAPSARFSSHSSCQQPREDKKDTDTKRILDFPGKSHLTPEGFSFPPVMQVPDPRGHLWVKLPEGWGRQDHSWVALPDRQHFM